MERLRDAVSKIGEEELANCVLVQEGVRNAFLLQYIDYGENSPNDPESSYKLAGIQEYFPELIQSESVQGMLISKNKYTWEESYDEADMGRILGFPCVDDFDYIVRNPGDPSVTIEIIVHLKPGGDKEEVQIMVYRCKNLSSYPKAVAFAKEAEQVLKKDPLVGPIIKSVKAKKTIRLGQTRRVSKPKTTPDGTRTKRGMKTKPFQKHVKTLRHSQVSRTQRGDQALK
jgi:hypothetical protein